MVIAHPMRHYAAQGLFLLMLSEAMLLLVLVRLRLLFIYAQLLMTSLGLFAVAHLLGHNSAWKGTSTLNSLNDGVVSQCFILRTLLWSHLWY